MKISVDQIKKLRAQTGAGIIDCRRALQESEGDLKKAVIWLQKRGLEKAAKKLDRPTGEGLVESYIHATGKIGAMVQLSCETDFVAKNEEFKKLAHELAMQVAAQNPKNVAELLKQVYIRDEKMTVDDLIKQAIAKFGENIVIKGFARLEI